MLSIFQSCPFFVFIYFYIFRALIVNKFELSCSLNLNYKLPPRDLTPEQLVQLRMIIGSSCAQKFFSEALRAYSDDIYQQALMFAFECPDVNTTMPSAQIATYIRQYVYWRLTKFISKHFNPVKYSGVGDSKRVVTQIRTFGSYESDEINVLKDHLKTHSVTQELEKRELEQLHGIQERMVQIALAHLTERSNRVFKAALYRGESFRIIGEREGITAARVQMIYRETIHDIRDFVACIKAVPGFVYDKAIQRFRYKRPTNEIIELEETPKKTPTKIKSQNKERSLFSRAFLFDAHEFVKNTKNVKQQSKKKTSMRSKSQPEITCQRHLMLFE